MGKFIKLTTIVYAPKRDKSGNAILNKEVRIERTIYIKKDAVVTVCPLEDGDGTAVAFSTGYTIIAKESSEEIFGMMK